MLLAFPVLFYMMDVVVDDFITVLGGFTEDSSEHIEHYMKSDFRAVSNIYGLIRTFIERLPIFIIMIFSIHKIFIKNTSKVPYIYETLLRMTFLLIYVSYLFCGQEVSAFVAPRFWDAASFPLTIFLSYYLFKQRRNSLIKACFALLVFAKLFNIFYEVYVVSSPAI